MVAKRRLEQAHNHAVAGAARTYLAPADSSHGGVDSPALRLQAKLDAAIAAPSNAYLSDSVVERWSGTTRVAILLGGTMASWVLMWEIARAML